MIIITILFILLVGADQLIKYLTISLLKPVSTVTVIKGILSLTYVENRGAAFGIMQNARWVFILLTVAIIAAIIVYRLKTTENSKLFLSAAVLLVSGGIGNLIDRIFRGFVVDMIQVTFIDYPVFNFADCCVVIGAVLMCIYVLKKDTSSERKNS